MTNNSVLQTNGLERQYVEDRNVKQILLRKNSDAIHAVDGVSMDVDQNDSIGVIGESGCGKTTLINLLMGLEQPTAGEILYQGEPLSDFDREEWLEYRRNVQIIFQDPFNSLDPKMRVRQTLMEPLHVHNIENKKERLHSVLEKVQLQPPEQYLDQFPGQLSGGEKQRVAIARALILEPSVILADEPVSMLDVSTQAELLKLLSNLIDEMNVSMVYISHDLSTVSYICDQINVMYLGRIVEQAPTMELLNDPQHPYSQALIDSIPIPDPYHDRNRAGISGSPPDPVNLGEGCRFRDRCPERMDICDETPAMVETDSGRRVACHLHYDHEEYVRETRQETGSEPGRGVEANNSGATDTAVTGSAGGNSDE